LFHSKKNLPHKRASNTNTPPTNVSNLDLTRENDRQKAILLLHEQPLPILVSVNDRPVKTGRPHVTVHQFLLAVRAKPGQHHVRVVHAAVGRQTEAQPAAGARHRLESDVRVREVPVQVVLAVGAQLGVVDEEAGLVESRAGTCDAFEVSQVNFIAVRIWLCNGISVSPHVFSRKATYKNTISVKTNKHTIQRIYPKKRYEHTLF